ncbi:MAG TPA: hypothetical protein VK698_09040 [Kofleriaceae bacterium]|nr:hypothetical protein [Kofleriaceae bacterium]
MVRSWLLVALGLLLAASASACGDGGGGHGDDVSDDDGADDGDGDGIGPDGSVGPGEPAEGQFEVSEIHFGEDGYQSGQASGSIVDARPRYHRLQDSIGACQLWTFEVGDCGECAGVCTADDECISSPVELSAGDVTLDSPGEDLVIEFQDYGYYPSTALPEDLFGDGDRVSIEAAGSDVEAFSLAADGVDAIDLELERMDELGWTDALGIEDGTDLELTWSPVDPGARVRLEILSNNRGHGAPVDVMIECEADDSGRMVVPRALVEAFPEKAYQNICAGSDCPPSSLTRFRADRAEVGGRDVELRVQAKRMFIVVHEPG